MQANLKRASEIRAETAEMQLQALREVENLNLLISSAKQHLKNLEAKVAEAKNTNKKFAEENIPFFTSFILGYWGETNETINETAQFIENNQDYLKAIGVNRYYIYPGSKDFMNIHELSQKYKCKLEYLPNLQSYIILEQGNLSGEFIEQKCNELESLYNEPVYFESVRSWRFR